jgi:hypothetical protein
MPRFFFTATLGLAIGSALASISLAEVRWPKLEKATTDFACLETLRQARSAFRSNNFYLYEPAPVAVNAKSSIVLQSTGLDISGGDGIRAQSVDFEKLPLNIPGQEASVEDVYHWQLKDTAGWRIAIVSENVGWRGNFYSVYRIDAKLSKEQFLSALADEGNRSLPSPVVEKNWRPPMVFQRTSNTAAWVVDVGQSFATLSPWRVYGANGLNLKPACEIVFSPKFEKAKDLLPKPLWKLVDNLFLATGTDEPNSGTLKSVALTRISAEYMWANVAMRPWAALAAKPYNTRERVNAGLKEWASNKKNEKVYLEIVDQYPAAERALARYYAAEFGKSSSEAAEMAQMALDLAYRYHFVFGTD